MSRAGRQERVVARRRRLGCEWPTSRRTRSWWRGTRPWSAPAPHDRVLRPRGAQASVFPGPQGPAGERVGQHTGGWLPQLV